MIERLRRLLVPRDFTPEEREYLTRFLKVSLRLSAVALLIGAFISMFAAMEATKGVLLAAVPVLIALRLAHRGRVNASAFVLLGSMLALATWLLDQGDGLQNIAILIYPVIVLAAGLVVERRPFILVVAATVLSLCWVAWGQAHGSIRLLAEDLRPEVVPNLLIACLLLGVAASLVHLMAGDLRASLRKARQSEQRYRLISEVSSDYTFSSVAEADGRVRQDWVAGAFEKMTGYTFEEYVAHGGWRAALHPDDVAQDDATLETLRSNRPVVQEVRTFVRSGETRWVRVYAHPVWSDEEKRLVGIYGAVQDITETKTFETERETLIRELAAKNAELERFTYTASHDLKSPLVTVRGFLGFVERDARDGNQERLQADLKRIRDATDKMGRLLDELLELSRVGRFVNPPAAVPLGDLVRDAASLVEGRLEARGVSLLVAVDLPTVWGDRGRLTQVIQNLLDNAVKFLGDQPDPRIEVGMRQDADQRVFYIRDNGRGVDPRHLERIFGLFDKLDPDTEGTGVGLALVQRIVDFHGGRVWVESDGLGHGATFCFTLPGPPGPAARPAASA